MPVRVFKAYDFDRWAKSEGLTDAKLWEAALEIENGLVNARLGGFLVKKRVGAQGRGKRGGYRTIVAHRQGDRLVFLHGFDKNDKDNISPREKQALHKLGDHYMTFSDAALSRTVRDGGIVEVRCHEQNPQERT
jgi:hypothetical protein